MNREFKIDTREAADIRARIGELASSYTPEWVFDPAKPDIGAVIGLVFARQTAETIARLNQTPDKYRTEFVNMLSLPLKPAHPAQGVVTMELSHDTIPGTDIPQGTKLLGSDEETSLVFETASDIHVTASRMREILAISPQRGKIIPIMGTVKVPPLFGEDADEEQQPVSDAFPAFTLFDFDAEGIGRDALVLYHANIFDTGGQIFIRAVSTDGSDLSGVLADPALFRWSWLSPGGAVPFASVSAKDGVLILVRGEEACCKEGGFSVIALEAADTVTKAISLQTIMVSSACEGTSPDFVLHNSTELVDESFMPFGETAALFDECYLGQDAVFSQAGAKISVAFDVSFREKLETFTPQEEADNLKIIKRKPQKMAYETARTMINRVNLEYYNGLGWRAIPCGEDMSGIFSGAETKLHFSFICPEDWQPLTVGGHTGRCLRIRVEQADNCYLRPCIHTMPVMSGLVFGYTYEDSWKTPQKARRISGTEETDITRQLREGHPFTAFEPLRYAVDGLYLGFDRKMENGPVGLFFKIEAVRRTADTGISVEYSTINGFQPLKIIDSTENLSTSGTWMFLPPPDFAEREIEGVRRYWLRIAGEETAVRPRIEEI